MFYGFKAEPSVIPAAICSLIIYDPFDPSATNFFWMACIQHKCYFLEIVIDYGQIKSQLMSDSVAEMFNKFFIIDLRLRFSQMS